MDIQISPIYKTRLGFIICLFLLFSPSLCPAQENSPTYLLLHNEGPHKSRTIIDEKGHPVFVYGETYIDATEKRIGNSSLFLNGRNGFLSVAGSPEWNLTASAHDSWTIDLWIKHANLYLDGKRYLNYHHEGLGSWIFRYDRGNLNFIAYNKKGSRIYVSGGQIQDTAWHHIALVKIDINYAIYLDGQQTAFQQTEKTIDLAGTLFIGAEAEKFGFFKGHMDAVRISHANIFNAAPNSTLSDKFFVPTETSYVEPKPEPEPTPEPTPVPEPSPSPSPSPSPTPNPANASSPLGTNLVWLTDWSGEWQFTNAFKFARNWEAGERYGCWNCAGPLDLDSNGWVKSLRANVPNGGQVASSVVLSGGTTQYVPGTYTIYYEGEGTIRYLGATKDTTASLPGMDVVNITPGSTGLLALQIVQTDPNNTGNYISNIQVMMPGYTHHKDTVQFHPDYLKNIQPYQVVRYMNLMDVTNSYVVSYQDYTQLSDAHWRELPAEKIAELSNITHTDPWVTIPHKADDGFVQQFASVLFSQLDPKRKIYIELSNETWNASYGHIMHDLAQKGCPKYTDLQLGCDQDASPQNGIYCEGYPSQWNTTCETARIRYYSERSVEIWKIFEQVFGGTQRLVRVIASQSSRPWLHDQYLQWNNAYRTTDALAVAPYFGYALGANTAVANWTLDQLFQELSQNSLPQAYTTMSKDIDHIKRYYPGMKIITYEGGQHLVGLNQNLNNQNMTNLFIAANGDPRMGILYQQYLNEWKKRGGELFVHFTNVSRWTKFGSWGAKMHPLQTPTESPKWDALMNFIANNPCWWQGCVPSATSPGQ